MTATKRRTPGFNFVNRREVMLMLWALNTYPKDGLDPADAEIFEAMQDAFQDFALGVC